MRTAIQHSDIENISVKRIINEGNNKGYNFFHVTKEDFQIFFSKKNVEIHLKGKKLSKENFDVLYLRQIASEINTYKAIAQYANRNGVYVVDYDGIISYGEKTNTYFKIAGKLNNLSLIPTFTGGVENFNGSNSIQFPCICKPIDGREGIGVELLNNQKELNEYLKIHTGEIMIQKYIRNDGDIRAYIAGDNLLGAMKRSSISDNVITNNLSTGGIAKKINIDKDIEKELVELVRILGYNIAGVDLVEEDGIFYVMEINKGGNFSGYEDFTGDDMAKKIVNYLELLPLDSHL